MVLVANIIVSPNINTRVWQRFAAIRLAIRWVLANPWLSINHRQVWPTSAPFTATRTLVKLAEDVKETHPVSSSVLLEDTYVDNLHYGSHFWEDLWRGCVEQVESMKFAGFSLRKFSIWVSLLLNNALLSVLITKEVIITADQLGHGGRGFRDRQSAYGPLVAVVCKNPSPHPNFVTDLPSLEKILAAMIEGTSFRSRCRRTEQW